MIDLPAPPNLPADPAVETRVRISCAGLCRIQDDQGRFLVALNSNRLSKGVRIFTPLGGGFTYHDHALLQRFDAHAEMPDSRELRLYLPPTRLNDFRTWFLSRREREIDPYRELREELVEELGAIPTLMREDVRFTRRYLHDGERVTDRRGFEGRNTRYWLEVFDVEIISDAVRAALYALPTDGDARWVTVEAIRANQTPDGETIEAGVILEQN
jgi:hypothetical protein